ncbi:hypothetical protein PC9H_000323 [Pleurotus ostreatus]|uniref:Uncharacterized protein n=1 Tax=Pleurotus ostreatus TaxID=5322 RepID=A0A8H7DZ92_PLEOS|nr:uncharacterized protein PC9H_000323 [Pleurotus ostreatus]KAF7439986.1 hypothetical protein PC9H_000323 [Pleurotus ostreatus]
MSLSYFEAVNILNSQETLTDVGDASQKLAKSIAKMIHEFDTVSAHLHTIDMQGLTAPMLPHWTALSQNFRQQIWQFRNNAGLISSRLTMFVSLVLPLATRNLNGGSSHNHQEKLQVLQSFIGVSSDHAAQTRSLTEGMLMLNSNLNAFHSNFARFAASRMTSGQSELQEVAQKIGQLDARVKQLYIGVGRLVGIEIAFLVFSTFRMVMSSGRTGKSKGSRHRLTLTNTDATAVSKEYDNIDRLQNEFAHADHNVQMQLRKTDTVSTSRAAISSLVSNQMVAVQAMLGLCLAIWARLQTDCMEILGWLQGSGHNAFPSVLSAYMEGGHTIYAPLARALDTFTASIDPSLFPGLAQQ